MAHTQRSDGATSSAPGAGRLRIAVVVPPVVPLPPPSYSGTERVAASLAIALHERGHAVTAFAPGDSTLPFEVVPVVPRALWGVGHVGDAPTYVQMALDMVWAQAHRFDIVHSHVGPAGFLTARRIPAPMVSTLHRRLDSGGLPDLLDHFSDVPLVAISESQRRWSPNANWLATIHHGLDFRQTPRTGAGGEHLLLVGRLSAEKGIQEAIEVARRTGRRLVIAAKAHSAEEVALYDSLVAPAIDEGIVDWRGEVTESARDELMASALATLMLGAWPEPFGLVAIESMATGTPVIARRAGAVTETIEHGRTGFLVDDISEAVLAVDRVAGLDRHAIAEDTRRRFSVERMTDQYEAAFARLLAGGRAHGEASGRPVTGHSWGGCDGRAGSVMPLSGTGGHARPTDGIPRQHR